MKDNVKLQTNSIIKQFFFTIYTNQSSRDFFEGVE